MSNFLSKDLGEHRDRYQQDIAGLRLVSKKEQHELWLKAMDGDEDAWHTLWLQGVRMVQKLVNKFVRLGRLLPGDEMDAIQEGNLAIGLALPNWSPNRGAYSTYVWTCIRNALTDYGVYEGRGGLTGEGAENTIQDAIELRPNGENTGRMPDRNIADWYGYAHDMDIDMLALTMDYDKILDEPDRKILDRFYFQDRSQEQIAEELDVSQPTVHRMVERAVNKLAEAYNQSI